MKRSTAVGHLVEIAQGASDLLRRLRGSDIPWPIEQMWVGGELLGFADTIDVGVVVLVLDVPADELPWLALHDAGEWVGEELRLPKRPLRWCYRPRAWPAWNHEHRRVVRFWSAGGGLDDTVIDGLRSRRLDHLDVEEPSADELARQLRTELVVSRHHLRETLTHYWERDWRREHQGYGVFPEDHLWRAAEAARGMEEALDALEAGT